ncbi:MAG TPA: CAP domain-containing protein [Chloroflexota bacterium]|nr:CAP domain-containing protein [Chloroflexota bacterium]
MRQGWISLAVFGAVALSLSATPVETVFADDPTSEVVATINGIRVENGLTPLVIQSQLVASAQAYAQAMARGGFFGHVAPNGSTMVTRNEAAGYTGWDFLEENIASGQTSVTDVVNAWLQSPQHRTSLLSPSARDTGVGFAYVPGSRFRYYWVEEFGKRFSTYPTISEPLKSTAPPANPVIVAKPQTVQPVPTAANSEVAVDSTILQSHLSAQSADERAAVFHRRQRDPENLNLFLIEYQNLSNDYIVAT